jgi:hypothetical protein
MNSSYRLYSMLVHIPIADSTRSLHRVSADRSISAALFSISYKRIEHVCITHAFTHMISDEHIKYCIVPLYIIV